MSASGVGINSIDVLDDEARTSTDSTDVENHGVFVPIMSILRVTSLIAGNRLHTEIKRLSEVIGILLYTVNCLVQSI